MKILSLSPYATSLATDLGAGEQLVASPSCPWIEFGLQMPTIPASLIGEATALQFSKLIGFLQNEQLLKLLKETQATILALNVLQGDRGELNQMAKEAALQLSASLGWQIKLFIHSNTQGLEAAMYSWLDFGELIGFQYQAREQVRRYKAQLMDWCDNFYDRTHNKKVAILSSVDPLIVAPPWVFDLVRLSSCHSPAMQQLGEVIAVQQLKDFAPDLLIVAPHVGDLKSAVSLYPFLLAQPWWDKIPAVKRGEVYFCCGGNNFYLPTPSSLSTAAVIISAIAGFESGYITPKDSFYKLRWIELFRHKILK